MNKETEEQIRELQILENTLQSLLMQKQALQLELSEVENAINELQKAKGEVYRIAGNIMIKAEASELSKELGQKKDLIFLRLKTLDTQENSLSQEAEKLRKKVLSKIKKE